MGGRVWRGGGGEWGELRVLEHVVAVRRVVIGGGVWEGGVWGAAALRFEGAVAAVCLRAAAFVPNAERRRRSNKRPLH